MLNQPLKPHFSIVIPTLNEEKYLPFLLEDLSQQSYQNFEVIHIDGNSEDKTIEKAQSYKQSFSIQSIKVEKRNVSYQRNYGGKKAKGEWVIFMDADDHIPPHFLDGIRYQLAKNPQTDLFTTWVTCDNYNKLTNSTISRVMNAAMELNKIVGKQVAFGGLIGVRKNLLTDLQFDETHKIVEDAYFIQAAIDKGLIFQTFKEPRFAYSLRRLRKEGTLKTAQIVAKIQLNYLLGEKFSQQDFGYVMKGGAYYNLKDATFWSGLSSALKKASKKQLAQARKIIKNYREI